MKTTWKEVSLGIILGLGISIVAIGYQQNRELEKAEAKLAQIAEPVIETYTVSVAEQAMEDIEERYHEIENIEKEGNKMGAPYDFISLDEDYQIYMEQRCADMEINFFFALSLMFSESSFNPNVIGDNGNSVGLFQINKCNWERMNDTYGLNVFEPYDNIDAGLFIIRELMDDYPDDVTAVVQCYKCGKARGEELMNEEIFLSCIDEIVDRAMEWQTRE